LHDRKAGIDCRALRFRRLDNGAGSLTAWAKPLQRGCQTVPRDFAHATKFLSRSRPIRSARPNIAFWA